MSPTASTPMSRKGLLPCFGVRVMTTLNITECLSPLWSARRSTIPNTQDSIPPIWSACPCGISGLKMVPYCLRIRMKSSRVKCETTDARRSIWKAIDDEKRPGKPGPLLFAPPPPVTLASFPLSSYINPLLSFQKGNPSAAPPS